MGARGQPNAAGTREEGNQCAFEQLEEDFKPGNYVQGSMKGAFHEKLQVVAASQRSV